MYDRIRFRSDLNRAWQELHPHIGKGVKAPFSVAFVAAEALSKSSPPRKVVKPVSREFGNYALLVLHAVWFLLQASFFSVRLLLKK